MANPIRSMTGYGRGAADCPAGRVTAEVRSLNHRFLEMFVRTPREALWLDPEVRRRVKERVARGKVEVFITLERSEEGSLLSPARARRLLGQLEALGDLVGDQVRLDHLLQAAAFARGEDPATGSSLEGKEAGEEALGKAALAALAEALDRLVRHREEEGASLAADVRARVAVLRALREQMVPVAASVPERVARQLREFLEKHELTASLDPGRLEAESALLASRADVSEELTRLVAHLAAMEEALAPSTGSGPGGKGKGGEGIGRRLDFLLQEANREVNTTGSKAADPALSALVVEAKSELEKIREQVQNLE